MFLRPNHVSRSFAELGQRGEGHVRIAHLLRGRRAHREGVWVLCPGVELEPLVGRRHTFGKRGRGDSVGQPSALLVATVRRGLADGDERPRIARLDACDSGRRELCVVGRADDLAGGVELRLQERSQIGLVPDPVEPDVREACELARVARRDRARESREVGQARGQELRLLVAVRPAGRAPDRHQDLLAENLCASHELVQIVELVRGIERVGRDGRPRRCDALPLDQRSDHRRPVLRRQGELSLATAFVPQHGVVVEPHPHAVVGDCGRSQDRGGDDGGEQGGEKSHVDEPPGGERGDAADATGSFVSGM